MRRHCLLLVLGVLVSGSLAAEAQQAGGSAIRGRAVDPQEGVLPGVAIVVTHTESGTVRETVTGPDGTYFITGIIRGPYRITGELQGFKRFTQEVRLQIGETATLDVTLEVGSVAESVTVTGEAPLVDLTSTQVAGNVTQGELTELPSANRSVMGFVALLPGVQYNPSAIGPAPSTSTASTAARSSTSSTAGTTTTTCGEETQARRHGPRSRPSRSSRSSRTSTMPNTAATRENAEEAEGAEETTHAPSIDHRLYAYARRWRVHE